MMNIPKDKQLAVNDLQVGKWYCAFESDYDYEGELFHSDGQLFEYVGEGQAEIDSNAIGEQNSFSAVPYADFYVLQH